MAFRMLRKHVGNDIGFFDYLGHERFRDVFGVVWDRSIDRDIGNPEKPLISVPDLSAYTFPDPHDQRFFSNIETLIKEKPNMFRLFQIGFSLYERVWALRGMDIQRNLAAKSLRDSQRGMIFAGFLKLFIPLIVVIPGIAAYVLVNNPVFLSEIFIRSFGDVWTGLTS